MLAARYKPGSRTLSLEDIPKPTPGPLEVVLKIKAAGICHSDLHVLHGEVPFQGTFTMGHEACGEIEEEGSSVTGHFKKGTLYAVHGPNPCGECSNCRSGHDNLCFSPTRQYIGIGADGAYAEYLKVPARNIVEVPEGISAEVAAVSTDAVLTPYHALKTLGNVRTNNTVLLLGLGGLGMNGVQVALALGAKVVACDLREGSLEAAKKLGAHEVYNSKDLEIQLKGRSFDVVIDFVGAESTFLQAQTFIKPGGTIVVVGLAAAKLPVLTLPLANFQVRVQGSFWGTHEEMKEIFELIKEKKISPQVEVGKLKDVNHWLEELSAGNIKSRMALIP